VLACQIFVAEGGGAGESRSDSVVLSMPEHYHLPSTALGGKGKTMEGRARPLYKGFKQ